MARVFRGVFRSPAGAPHTVVIKRLRDHLASEIQAARRFTNEAALQARVRHPNVVAVHDVGRDAEGPFIALEWVDGASLKTVTEAARARGTRLEMGAAIRILLDALRGLAAAHEACDDDGLALGILHRDVTPHNILVGYDGRARLTDFGIATSRDGPKLTAPGLVVGKLDYLSPEYLSQGLVDARMDLYAMGITAWEALIGRRPFRKGQRLSSGATHLRVTSLEHGSGVPREIARVVLRACQHAPGDRYPSATAMADELEEGATATGMLASRDEVSATLAEILASREAEPRERPPIPALVRSWELLGIDETLWRAEAPTLRE